MDFYNKEFKGISYAVLSGILYGFISYFGISLLQNNYSITSMLFWRFLFSSIFISLALLLSLKNIKLPSLKIFILIML